MTVAGPVLEPATLRITQQTPGAAPVEDVDRPHLAFAEDKHATPARAMPMPIDLQARGRGVASAADIELGCENHRQQASEYGPDQDQAPT